MSRIERGVPLHLKSSPFFVRHVQVGGRLFRLVWCKWVGWEWGVAIIGHLGEGFFRLV